MLDRGHRMLDLHLKITPSIATTMLGVIFYAGINTVSMI
jgi:hypothetical protein